MSGSLSLAYARVVWRDAVESVRSSVQADPQRRERGRALVAAGAVGAMRCVRPGRVVAPVRGDSGVVYEVTLERPPVPGRVWDDVARRLSAAGQPVTLSAAGALPAETVLAVRDCLLAASMTLTVSPRTLRASCTCPDAGRMGAGAAACKHVCAALEATADAATRFPGDLLLWMGADLAALEVASAAAVEPPEHLRADAASFDAVGVLPPVGVLPVARLVEAWGVCTERKAGGRRLTEELDRLYAALAARVPAGEPAGAAEQAAH